VTVILTIVFYSRLEIKSALVGFKSGVNFIIIVRTAFAQVDLH